MIVFCGRTATAQELVLGGGFIGGKQQHESKPNSLIKTTWGKSVAGISLQIGGGVKGRWGMAEVPTFLLKLKNNTDQKKEIVVSSADLMLVINERRYVWNAPDTKLVSTIQPGEIKSSFFILRFEPAQWKLAEGTQQEELEPRLKELVPGKKKFEVQLRLGESQLASTGSVDFEISKTAFELPSVNGLLLGQDGKPLADADIYLCSDAQFSIYYSNFDGKWFKTKNVSHYDPFGGFSRVIKPVKSGKKGEFSLSPNMHQKRIVVLPPVGSAQVFELPTSYSKWQVKLKGTGSVLLEHDIPGETSTVNSSFSSSRQLAIHPQRPTQVLRLTESFGMPLSNGKKYELKNLIPGTYSLNRYKYVRVGNRSYSVGRMNRSFHLREGENLEYRMVRKKGQKISLTALKIPSNSQYVVASIFAMDQRINTNSIYSNETLWSDAAPNPKQEAKFQSCLISPGKYRLVVMSVPQGKNPNSYTYKPDRIGSKVIEVGTDGAFDAGKIQLYPVEVWSRNSGMLLSVKLIDQAGNAANGRFLWPITKGYNQRSSTTALITNVAGVASMVQPAGKYLFAAGLDQHQPIFFEVNVPRMTPQTIILPESPAWKTDEAKLVELDVVARFIAGDDSKIEITVNNKGKNAFRPAFGDVQLLTQTLPTNKSTGVRFLPDRDSELYQMEFKPSSKTKVELNWDDLIAQGICTTARLSSVKFSTIKTFPAKSKVYSKVRFGPALSKEFQTPELPKLPSKPFQ